MKIRHHILLLACLLLPAGWAHAAITCSISSPGFYAVYDGLATTPNLNMSSYTVTCSRLSGDPMTLNYITFTDDGLYNNGSSSGNRAKLTTSTNYIKYDFYTDSTYSANWSKSNKCIIGTLNFGSALSASQTRTYYSRLAALLSPPQGTYTDTVTASMSYNQSACVNNASQDASTSFPVTISNVPGCQIATPPGDVAFAYTSYSGGDIAASTSFQARCTTNVAYTMALDAYSGSVIGLNYGLTLSASSGTGNGALQSHIINGTMLAGQSGICATATCSGSQARSLTISY